MNASQITNDDLISFAVLDHTGDTKYTWDPSQPAEVEIARTTFASLLKKGFAAFLVTDRAGEKGEQVREFLPSYRAVIFTPPMVGG